MRDLEENIKSNNLLKKFPIPVLFIEVITENREIKDLIIEDANKSFLNKFNLHINDIKKESFFRYFSHLSKDDNFIDKVNLSLTNDDCIIYEKICDELNICCKISIYKYDIHKIILLIEDISEIAEKDKLINELKEKLEIFRTATEQGFIEIDYLKHEVNFNSHIYKILNLDFSANLTDENWHTYIHPDDYNYVKDLFIEHIEGKSDYFRAEFRHLTDNNNYKWVLSTGKVIKKTNDNKPLKYVGILIDIDEIKKNQKIIEEYSKLLENLINSSEDFICYIDENKKIKIINEKFKILIQNNILDIDKILTTDKNENLHKFIEKLLNDFDEIIQNEQISRFEYHFTNSNGNDYYFDIIQSPIFDNMKNSKGLLIVGRDISEKIKIQQEKDAFFKELTILNEKLFETNSLLELYLYQKENLIKELENTKNKLIESNKEKDKLFSIISHDLRGPFNGLLGLSKLLTQEIENMPINEAKNLMYVFHNSIQNIFKLIENLLEWSKLQLQNVKFKTEYTDINLIIESEISNNIPQITMKNLIIKNELPDNLKIKVDENLFRVIIRNLISNAIKFTPKNGEIYIRYINLKDFHQFSVIDSGIGIPQNLLDKLFTLDSTTNRLGTEGEKTSGLGLIIAKEYVEKHNGKISVKSEENKGSEFTFTISKNL